MSYERYKENKTVNIKACLLATYSALWKEIESLRCLSTQIYAELASPPPGSCEYFQERATEAHQQGENKKVNKQTKPSPDKNHSDHICKD